MLPITVVFGPEIDGPGSRWEHQHIHLNFASADGGQRREVMAVPVYKLEGIYWDLCNCDSKINVSRIFRLLRRKNILVAFQIYEKATASY